MYVDPIITNTEPFGVFIETEEDECDAITTRLHLQTDDKDPFSSLVFDVADFEDSALIKESVTWVCEFEEDKIFLTVMSTIYII